MSFLASSRYVAHNKLHLPHELVVSCFHTSPSSCSPPPRQQKGSPFGFLKASSSQFIAASPSRKRPVKDFKPRSKPQESVSAAPSRKRLVKDLKPRSKSGNASGSLIVAKPIVRDAAPHVEAVDWHKERIERISKVREVVERKRERRDARVQDRPGRWERERTGVKAVPRKHTSYKDSPYKERSHAAKDGDLPDFDQPWRTRKGDLHKQKDRADSYGVKQDAAVPVPAAAESPPKSQIFNPLSDEFDASARAVSTRQLPSEFTSPPLMEGLLNSVSDVLGPHARPTPIQALSLKHLFPRKLSSTNPASTSAPSGDAETEWQQCLLASETGSGKSIAYLLPMLQDLKRSELLASSGTAAQSSSELPINPRALVIAPTHELSRQLSGFAKALLHGIKLRVLCVSQANLPSTSKRNVRASKMSKDMDAVHFDEVDGSANPEQDPTSREAGDAKKNSHPVDVVVGTPSKILELVKGRGWNYEQPKIEDTWDVDESGKAIKPRRFTVGKPEMGLANVEWVVVDEADVLFDPDFQEDTKTILSSITEAKGQTLDLPEDAASPESPAPLNYPFNLLLSTATIPSALAWYLDTYHPSLLRLASPNLHHLPSTLKTEYASWTGGNRNADVEHRLRRVWHDDSMRDTAQRSKVVIFCNKSARVEDLGRYLKEKGIANVALTSTSEARKHGSNHHLDGFLRPHGRSAETDGAASADASSPPPVADPPASVDLSQQPHVMITTSLLSRGLDFAPEIRHVFIVDEPRNMVDFLHRAGRSGRAGERGKVVVFGKTKGRGSDKARDMRKRVGALVA